MKAVAFAEYGPSNVLRLVDRDDPRPADDEIVIRVAAAGVNPADWRLRNGQFKLAFKLDLPFVPGSDVAGTVEAVGPAVAAFKPGDRVFAMSPLKEAGGYAERIAVKAVHAAVLPDSLAFEPGAATPLAGLTALQGLRDQGRVQPGQSVLVNGGSGGVGSFAVQIAKAMGAEVTAVCSGASAPFVRRLGVDEVIDYKTADPFAGPRRFDVVFDTLALVGFRRWRSVLKEDGTLVTVNPVVGKILPGFLVRLLGVNRLRSFFVEPSGADLRALGEDADAGRVIPQVERTFPLVDAAAAMDLSEAGRVRGKLVITVA